ncbi:MAG: papain-like cysteine protease family protein, partial [Gemmatimonadaceae bacterium]
MRKIKLDVPVLAQEKSMCCWHTSAMMIWFYWQEQNGRSGPMNTVKPVYDANTGLSVSVQSFITLAKTTGLKPLPAKNTYSNDDLFALLRDSGPLWCAGTWYGAGHVIVLTGIDGGTVFLNDPDGAQRKTGTLAWFNEKLLNGLDGCTMAKDKA